MKLDASPTARALLALELIQDSPGHHRGPAGRQARRLGAGRPAVRRRSCARPASRSSRSAGRTAATGVGRGLRLPPLMFSATEALGLVMAVLDGHHDVSDPTDPVGSALGKIVRALPEPVAAPGRGRPPDHRAGARPGRRPARSGHHDRAGAGLLGPPPGADRLPLRGRVANGRPRSTRGRSSSGTAGGTCCAGRTAKDARRAYRIDRVRGVEVLDDTFDPPADLDPVADAGGASRGRLGVRRRGRHRRAARGGRPVRSRVPSGGSRRSTPTAPG